MAKRYRDERGRFVSKDYVGKTYISRNKGEKLEFVGMKVPKAITTGRKSQGVYAADRAGMEVQKETFNPRRTKTVIDIDNSTKTEELVLHEPFTGNKTTTDFIEKTGSKKWANPTDDSTYEKKSTDESFEFSYAARQKHGYTMEQQKEWFDIFKAANKRLEEINDLLGIGGKGRPSLGVEFSYNMNIEKELMARRLASAEKVLSDSYIEELAEQYKKDFIENFSQHLAPEDFSALQKAVNSLTDFQFLQLLKNTSLDHLSYALDSVIDTFGYNKILDEVNFIISKIESGQGVLYD